MSKDFSNMFSNAPKPAVPAPVKTAPKLAIPAQMQRTELSPTSPEFKDAKAIMSWRQDLSDKVKEYVDTVEHLTLQDVNPLDAIRSKVAAIAEQVLESVDKGIWIARALGRAKPVLTKEQVAQSLKAVDTELQAIKRPDPFSLQSSQNLIGQAEYLNEQLAKAGTLLDKIKAASTDTFQIDSLNRRMQTLYNQQQLIAMGSDQIKRMVEDIQTRPLQVTELITVTLPMYRMLCLDVLAGAKQSQELRKIL